MERVNANPNTYRHQAMTIDERVDLIMEVDHFIPGEIDDEFEIEKCN